jgi:amino acid permease
MTLVLSFNFLATMARITLIETSVPQNIFKKIQKLQLTAEKQDKAPAITDHRSDLNEITYLLFGKSARTLITLTISLKFWFATTAYCIIFATGFASNIPFFGEPTCNIYETDGELNTCRWVYTFYVLIFGVIMSYLSTRDLAEQKIWQMIMAAFRFIMIGLVLMTALGAIATNTYIDSTDENPVDLPEIVDLEHAGTSIPIIAFATVFIFALPMIIEHLSDKGVVLNKLVVAVAIVTGILYLGLGLIVPLAMKETLSNVTINYRGYSAG